MKSNLPLRVDQNTTLVDVKYDKTRSTSGGVSGLRSVAMSDHAFDFLQSWIVENVNATMYEDKDTAEHLADDCIWEPNTRGITKAALIEAAGSDLNEYMLAKLNRVVGREVENKGPLSLRETTGVIPSSSPGNVPSPQKGGTCAYNSPGIAVLPPSCRQIVMASSSIRRARVRGSDAHRKSSSQR